MRKVHLLLLPIMALTLASCANNGAINYISVGEAIEFAKENFDSHTEDGYNVDYTINSNDSRFDRGMIFQKHYYDPTKQEGEYFIEKVGDFDFDFSGLEGIFYYTRCISFNSVQLLDLHEAIDIVRREIGYIENGFIKTNNHLGYYIHSDHLHAITEVLSNLLEIFKYLFEDVIVTILAKLLEEFTASESTFTFKAELTRFGFLDNVNLKVTAKNVWFDFSDSTGLPDTFYGDYLSIDNVNANVTFKANYSL